MICKLYLFAHDRKTRFIYFAVPFPREYLALPLSLSMPVPLSLALFRLPLSLFFILPFRLFSISNLLWEFQLSLNLFYLFLILFSIFFFVACCKNISNASHFVDHSNQTQALRLMLLQCTEVQWGRCRARAGQGYVVGFVVDSAAKQIKTFARKMPLNELQHYCCLLLLSPLLLLWLSKCS